MLKQTDKKLTMTVMLFAAVMVLVDQLSKLLVAANFTMGENFPLIPGALDFVYTTNPGIAFGQLEGFRWVFVPLTIVILVALVVYVFVKKPPKILLWALGLVISGGFGNLIDRVFRGEVVDFLQFKLSWFEYIFNVADCCVVIGGGLLILYLIIDIFKEKKENSNSSGSVKNDKDDNTEIQTDGEKSDTI